MAVPMANDPPFATLNHFAADLGIPGESDLLRIGIRCFDGTGGGSWRDGSLPASSKLEAVRLIKDRGVSYVQASRDLGVHPSQLRDWVQKFADDPQHTFPGHGQMKPEQLEIARLKREVAKLKAERDILKKAAAYFAKELT